MDEALPIKFGKVGKDLNADDWQEKKRKKQASRQKQQNTEYLASVQKRLDSEEVLDVSISKVRKGKRAKSPDPWAHLNSNQPKFGDVVMAPPVLTIKPKLKAVDIVKEAMKKQAMNKQAICR